MTDKKWQTVLDLREKFKITDNLLAEFIGCKKSMFSEKINCKRGNSLTDTQKEKISNYLLSMGKVLVNELGG